MLRLFMTALTVAIIACRPVHQVSTTEAATAAASAGCSLGIVGGGIAGLYTAYKLGPRLGARICLFEKEARLGGRIFDTTREADQVDGPFIAVGARRVMSGQTDLLKLAAELGIPLERPAPMHELIYARGMYSFIRDEFIAVYPGLPVDRSRGHLDEQLFEKLFQSPERARIDQYPTWRAYVLKVLGQSALDFLHDTSRFRADIDYELSARGYLEYLEQETKEGVLCPNGACMALYPVGGMSAYVRALAERVRGFGVRVYTAEPVTEVADQGEAGFTLTTPNRQVTARNLVIAVPPAAFPKITGTITGAIRAMPQFQAIVPIRVTTVAQWYDAPWWRQAVASDGKSFWRAWTTKSCINSIEIPLERYAARQYVIRAVYNDGPACAAHLASLARKGGGALESEIDRGLKHLFANNGLTAPVTIPRPLKTVFWDWPDGWHYLRAGAPYSGADMMRWAVQPLPGKSVALVGEAFNPQRSAWVDAAIKSADHYLGAYWRQTAPIETY